MSRRPHPDRDDAKVRGAFPTPHGVAARLADAALDGAGPVRTACDPAAGDGRLLVAVAARHEPGSVRCFAADLDGGAWHAGPGRDLVPSTFVVADALHAGRATWPDAPPEGFDLVIGNPPFLSQLDRRTASSAAVRADRRRAFGAAAGGYVDVAAIFLVLAAEVLAHGGRVAMIMPLSFLAARDAAPSRRRVLESCALDGIWVPGTSVFPDAEVQVCALILERGGPRRRSVRRWSGEDWTPAPPRTVDADALAGEATWSPIVADLLDPAPPVELDGPELLGDLVAATAGFRDHFYGLAPLVVDVDGPVCGRTDGMAPMITSGSIEPGRVAWGRRPARIAGSRWQAPSIDPGALDPATPLARWVADRRRPKLVVATQTKVLEAAPDPTGEWVPSTPVIAVHPRDVADLWRALAVLLAPPVSAWARARYAGTALHPTSIKLSAGQVATIPLPIDPTPWSHAAEVLERGWSARLGGCSADAVHAAATAMTAAYRADPDVTGWWASRAGILSGP